MTVTNDSGPDGSVKFSIFGLKVTIQGPVGFVSQISLIFLLFGGGILASILLGFWYLKLGVYG